MSRADWIVFIAGFIVGVLGLGGWVIWVLSNHRRIK